MKFRALIILQSVFLFMPFAALAVDAATAPAPKPAIQIPGFEGFSQITRDTGNNAILLIPYIGEYIAALFKYSVGAGAIIAAFMITIGGFQYVASAGMPKAVNSAKKRIQNALIGFLLLLGSYVFLYSISPDLVNLKSISLLGVKNINLETDSENPDNSAGGFDGVAVCTTIESCKTITDKPSSEWPPFNDKTVALSAVTFISGENISNPNSKLARPEVVQALVAAAKSAGQLGYSLTVTSGYRPLKDQLQLAKNDIRDHQGKDLGHSIAWPGTSNHGTGLAIDLKLVKNGVDQTCAGYDSCDQKNAKYTDPAKLLVEIMSSAGFKRLRKEMWHFELGTSGGELCANVNDCTFPPSM